MSDETSNSTDGISSLIGKVFFFLVPASLIVMLGIVGVAFLGGSGPEKKPEEKEAAPAPAPAVADAKEAAPAETAAVESAPAAEDAAAEGGEVDPEVMKLGQTSYATCAACHGPDGKGLKAGPALMAPSLVGSELLLGDPDKPLLVVLKGIAKENMDYMGVMAPLGAALDDQKLAAVLTFVRNNWGNSAPAVTVEQAAAAREKFAAVNAPAGVKRAEIDKIVADHK